jgi:predicted nucleic acid-binding protein
MHLTPGQTILWEKVSATECRILIQPRVVIKPDPMGALNFAKEHGLPQRRSDEVLAELREGEEE